MPSIWVIEKTIFRRDMDNYPDSRTDLLLDEHGYFTTGEAALAKCAELNANSNEILEGARNKIERENLRLMTEYDRTMRHRDILKLNDVRDLPPAPQKPYLKAFNEHTARENGSVPLYTALEIEPNQS